MEKLMLMNSWLECTISEFLVHLSKDQHALLRQHRNISFLQCFFFLKGPEIQITTGRLSNTSHISSHSLSITEYKPECSIVFIVITIV